MLTEQSERLDSGWLILVARGGTDSETVLWVPLFQGRPTADHREHYQGTGHSRDHAHRWRKIRLLPDPGPAAAGHHHRHLAADLVDEGPGGRPTETGDIGGFDVYPSRQQLLVLFLTYIHPSLFDQSYP